MDPAKLKVVELRTELSSRGLDTKGNKPVLVQRLRDALLEETGEVFNASISDTSSLDAESPSVSKSRRSRNARQITSPSTTAAPITSGKRTSSKRGSSVDDTPTPIKLRVIQQQEGSNSDSADEASSDGEEIISGDPLPWMMKDNKSQGVEPITATENPITVSEPQKNLDIPVSPKLASPVKEKIDAKHVEKTVTAVVTEKTITLVTEQEVPATIKKDTVQEKTLIFSIKDKVVTPVKEKVVSERLEKTPTKEKVLSTKEEKVSTAKTPVKEKVTPAKEKSTSSTKQKDRSTTKEKVHTSTKEKERNSSKGKTTSEKEKDTETTTTDKITSSPKDFKSAKRLENISTVANSEQDNLKKASSRTDETASTIENIPEKSLKPKQAGITTELLKSSEDEAKKPEDNLQMEIDSSEDSNSLKSMTRLSEPVIIDDDTSEVMEVLDNEDSMKDDELKKLKKQKRSRWGSEAVMEMNVDELPPASLVEEPSRDMNVHVDVDVSEDNSRPYKRHHSRSLSPVALPPLLTEEDEPDLDESKVQLSWFDSDLHLQIDSNTFCKAKPISQGALAHVWAGTRASHGVTKGKVAYEVKLLDKCRIDRRDEDENSYAMVVGWSTTDTSMLLGDEKLSFGYGSFGKTCLNNDFKEYGCAYSIDDVIGVYLDLDSTPCTISYTVNGVSKGVAFEFDKSDLQGKALFPHILTKNIAFRVNFGQEKKSLLNKSKIVRIPKNRRHDHRRENSKSEAVKGKEKGTEECNVTVKKIGYEEESTDGLIEKSDKIEEISVSVDEDSTKNEKSVNIEGLFVAVIEKSDATVEDKSDKFIEDKSAKVENESEKVEITSDELKQKLDKVEDKSEIVEEKSDKIADKCANVKDNSEQVEHKSDNVEDITDRVDDASTNVENKDKIEETRLKKSEKVEDKSEKIEVKSEKVEVKSETVEVKSETVEVKSETVEIKSETVEVKSETVEVKSETVEEKSEASEEKSEKVDDKLEKVEDKSETVEDILVKDDKKKEDCREQSSEENIEAMDVTLLLDDDINEIRVIKKPRNVREEYEYIEQYDDDSVELFILEGYTYIGSVPLSELVCGPRRPLTRPECEVLMMCGLPGAGKTHWACEWVSKHPEKRYTTLGTQALIDKMKNFGTSKKTNYAGDWQALIEASSKSVSNLISIASKRRRNYILDQTNVYAMAQKRKIRSFGSFVRKAVIISPSEEDWADRVKNRDTAECKEISESGLMTMKANFSLPEVGLYFNEVIYVDSNETDSKSLMSKFNKDGNEAGFGAKNKRSRFDSQESDRSMNRGYRNDRSHSRNQDYRSHSFDRRSSERPGYHNRRGGNDMERYDRGPPHRGGGRGRFGGPPAPGGGWNHQGHQERGGGQWGGREARGGGPPNWRGGPPRGGDGHRGNRDSHRGGGGGDFRGPPRGGRGGFNNRDGGRHQGNWNNRGGSGGGPPHGHRGGDRQGPKPNWDTNKPPKDQNPRDSKPAVGGSWQGWNGPQQGNWNQWGGQGQGQQQGQGQWGGQNWGGQGWNQQNWPQQQQQQQQQQQNWGGQQWGGGGWKGYGQWGGAQGQQYWNQWGAQGQQASAAGTQPTAGAQTTSGAQTPAVPAGGDSKAGTATTANQYSTSYPNMPYANTNTNAGANMAQMYQNWAQYAQAYANYGQQQQNVAAQAPADDKKKK